MPKRSFDEKMDYYLRKMEKLRDKHRRKRRRLDSFSSENDPGEIDADYYNFQDESEPSPDLEETGTTGMLIPDVPLNETQMESASTTPQNDVPVPSTSLGTEAPPQLDPEVLSALGEATDSGPVLGQEIHNNLSQLWLPLLKKGMEKEAKDKLLKQYLIPSNCTLLQAPKLNIEISAAVGEMVRLRDKKVESTQQQLGIGVTAISRAMSSLLTSDNKIDAIRMLSDGCRILCDLHHSETQARIKMITPGLARPFLNVIQESERDETLFGVSLPEKIKASKTIEKQGLQIKKSVPPARSNSAPSTSTARQQFQGNWSGSPRYPSNRGGRGGQRRLPTSSRRPAATTTTSTQSRPNQGKSRAPPRP
ncbi:hypothetical protein ABMA27_004971 [Loxostege sticticalis]|uniref:Uncharacterized protein n=1 Tax=Loxostege sticticalis TaxID=481309 RepID=A0ABR3HLE0_LOXSC